MPGDRFIELATAEDRRVLDILFRHASEAVTVQDRSGRLLYANDEAARIVGFSTAAELVSTPPEEIVGRFEMIDRTGAPLTVDSLPGRKVMAGAPVADAVIGYRRPGSPHARWSRVRASPIKNDAGEVVLVLNFFQDMTAQFRREEVQELLYTVYEALGSSLDKTENLHELARALVPRMGSWCAVHMLEGGKLIPMAMVHPDDEDARILVHMSDPGPISLDEDQMQARVARTEKPEIIDMISDEMLQEAEVRAGKELIDAFRRLDLNSVACVPISLGRRLIGTLTLARSFPDPELDGDDVDLLEVVADRAAAALENASLYQQQREIAETLQAVITPSALPQVPGLDLAARYRPVSLVGQVGGDFYDVFPTGRRAYCRTPGRHRRQGCRGGGGGRIGPLHASIHYRPRPLSDHRVRQGQRVAPRGGADVHPGLSDPRRSWRSIQSNGDLGRSSAADSRHCWSSHETTRDALPAGGCDA